MMDFNTAFLTLSRQGFCCSQILMKLALDLDDTENPGLLRAMSSLGGGMGGTGGVCGTLTGGVCVLGYFTGRGEDGQIPHAQANPIITEYIDWFQAQFFAERCLDLLGGDISRHHQICPPMIESAFFKLVELLKKHRLVEGLD